MSSIDTIKSVLGKRKYVDCSSPLESVSVSSWWSRSMSSSNHVKSNEHCIQFRSLLHQILVPDLLPAGEVVALISEYDSRHWNLNVPLILCLKELPFNLLAFLFEEAIKQPVNDECSFLPSKSLAELLPVNEDQMDASFDEYQSIDNYQSKTYQWNCLDDGQKQYLESLTYDTVLLPFVHSIQIIAHRDFRNHTVQKDTCSCSCRANMNGGRLRDSCECSDMPSEQDVKTAENNINQFKFNSHPFRFTKDNITSGIRIKDILEGLHQLYIPDQLWFNVTLPSQSRYSNQYISTDLENPSFNHAFISSNNVLKMTVRYCFD